MFKLENEIEFMACYLHFNNLRGLKSQRTVQYYQFDGMKVDIDDELEGNSTWLSK